MTSPVWHPFTQHGLGDDIPLIARAEGATLYGADGGQWIDAISSWWVTTHGHGHPKIAAAIADQAARLDQIIFAGWTHEPAETLAAELVRITPDALTKVFFSDSGSTSVEVALKMALGFFVNRGEPGRNRVIVMDDSYHGDTIGAMSVGARGVYNAAWTPLLFDVDRIPFPAAGNEQATLDALETRCQSGRAAALIVEPLILGAGGMLIYLPATLSAMREICAHHGVLFIADEVMTGWGRTGTLFACEQAGIAPDLMCLSKGLTGGAIPLAVTLATDEIFASFLSTDRARAFFHSSSYTANPVACAAANANLAIWRDEPVLTRIAAVSDMQERALAGLAARADTVNARRIGTITAVDVRVEAAGYLSGIAPHIMRHCRARGVLIRPLGNVVYVMPPYCITQNELDTVYAAIVSALDALALTQPD